MAAPAKLHNPIITGWWNYYGAFYPTAMLHPYEQIGRALERRASANTRLYRDGRVPPRSGYAR